MGVAAGKSAKARRGQVKSMCPLCITSYLASAPLAVGMAGSAGGLAALVVKKIRSKKIKWKENRNATSKGRV